MAAVYVRSLSHDKQRCFAKIYVSKDEVTTTWSIDGAYGPPFPERKHKIAGYCRGVYCLEFEDGKSLLWNPSKRELKKFKFLPPSELKTPQCDCLFVDCSVRTASSVRGVGFDPKSGDYKVVRLATNFYCHDAYCYSTKQVEIYSLNDDRWKEIGNEGDDCHIMDDYATYLAAADDGCCYWICQTTFSNYPIVSLNLSRYEFSNVTPPPVASSFESGAFLTDYKGSLAFVIHSLKYIEEEGKKYKIMSCWVMGSSDEWINTIDDFKFKGAEKPLGFCGDALMLEAGDGGLLIYDSHQNLLRKIRGIYDYPLCMCISPLVHLEAGRKEKENSNWSLMPHKKERKRKEMKKHAKRKGKKMKKKHADQKGKETMKNDGED